MDLQPGYVADPDRYYEQYAAYYGYFCIYPRYSSQCGITNTLTNNAILLYPRGMVLTEPAPSIIRRR